MKLRTGFVSNSSSESFTCDVCKNTISGWDMGLSDADMYICVNSHTFCEEHVTEDILEKLNNDDEIDRYEIPTDLCPICTLKVPYDKVLLDFALMKLDKKYDELFEVLKTEFKDLNELQKVMDSSVRK